jgi:hypothetical protein
MISSIMCAVGIIVAIQTFGGWIWLTGLDSSMRILGLRENEEFLTFCD